jgi:hypothetical protein
LPRKTFKPKWKSGSIRLLPGGWHRPLRLRGGKRDRRLTPIRVIWVTSNDGVERHTEGLVQGIKGASAVLNHTLLLQKLIAIERAIGVADNNTVRNMVYESQSHLLQIQREAVEVLPLRPRIEMARRFQRMRQVA